MKAFIAAICLSVWLLPASAAAQEAEVRDVISSQLEAFEADDFEGAFAHASPDIQSLFGDAARFGTMVREGYPMVHRPGDVRFLGLEPDGEDWRQRVLIRDADGGVHVLDYDMTQIDGRWRIDGVRFVEAPDVGA